MFRATVEVSFLRESRVARFLESQQKFLRSVDVMSGLLRQLTTGADTWEDWADR